MNAHGHQPLREVYCWACGRKLTAAETCPDRSCQKARWHHMDVIRREIQLCAERKFAGSNAHGNAKTQIQVLVAAAVGHAIMRIWVSVEQLRERMATLPDVVCHTLDHTPRMTPNQALEQCVSDALAEYDRIAELLKQAEDMQVEVDENLSGDKSVDEKT